MQKNNPYFNKKKLLGKGNVSQYSQGIYTAKNKQKCLNKNGKIHYKSSYEAKFAHILDVERPNVLKWGYETLTLTYKSPIDKKLHRYYMDFIFDVKKGNGEIETYLVEIKPSKEKEEIDLYESKGITIKRHGNMKDTSWLYKQRAFLINIEKWRAARRYCKSKGYIFIVITEKDLFK